MNIFVESFPFVPLLIAAAGAGVGLFMAGEARGHRNAALYLTPPAQHVRVSVDPYPHVPARPDAVPRTDGRVVVLWARVEQLEERVAQLEAEQATDRALLEKYRARAVTLDRLRSKWFRLWRIERERVRYAFGDLWDRRRKPSREKVAGIVLPFPGERVKLLPPVVAVDFLVAAS